MTNNYRKYRSNSQTNLIKGIMNCEGIEVVFYDLETTGLDPQNDRIIEFSGVKCVIANNSFVEVDRKTLYINPEMPLPAEIVKITGYTDDFLKDKYPEKEALPLIGSFLKGVKIVAGYNNNSFDNEFLRNLYQRYDIPISFFMSLESFAEAKDAKVRNRKLSFDVLWTVREYIAKTENYKLQTVANYLGVDKDIDFHKASSDVLATVRIINVLIPDILGNEGGVTGDLRPKIISVSYYDGYKGYSRVYVNTTSGTFFYDIRDGSWQGKDVDVYTLDMPHIVDSLLSFFGISTEKELRKSTAGKGMIYFG